jgi:DNA-binding response OmpR family regulator
MARTALIIEDDPDLARLVQVHLRDIHCGADIAREGQQALALSSMHTYDLIVLDLMLPDMDGLAVCKQLREREDYLPILMLTSKSTELDRVLGLEMGADDYLTKPFSIAELLARIKALFRRTEALSQNRSLPQTCEMITHGDLVIEVEKHQARVGNVDLDLTAREFDLLLHFARHPGRVFSRAQLLDMVWGYGHEGYEHTVNSHINRLRSKIEPDPAHPAYIVTVWGVGYKLEPGTAVTNA